MAGVGATPRKHFGKDGRHCGSRSARRPSPWRDKGRWSCACGRELIGLNFGWNQPFSCQLNIIRIQLKPEKPPFQLLGNHSCRPRTDKRIEHQPSRRTPGKDRPFTQGFRIDREVSAPERCRGDFPGVAGILAVWRKPPRIFFTKDSRLTSGRMADPARSAWDFNDSLPTQNCTQLSRLCRNRPKVSGVLAFGVKSLRFTGIGTQPIPSEVRAWPQGSLR